MLADVSFGAGTEVYVQRIRETVEASNLRIELIETTPVRELNDDHAQYEIESARCLGQGAASSVELVGSFEHDAPSATRRIRIGLTAPGRYRVTQRIVRPRTRSR